MTDRNALVPARMKNLIAAFGLLVLALLAIVGKSAVMFVSVLGMGVIFWLMRHMPRTSQLGATALVAVLAGLAAEGVHTLYHVLEAKPAAPGGDDGGFFVSATLVGLINAAAFVTFVVLVDWGLDRWSSSPGTDP